MTAAEYIARDLDRRGVTHVYELAGGMIVHLLDAIAQHGKTRIVSMHHEQAAGFAAEGHARMTGKPAVALATSGPGAINLLTAIGSCYFDSTPCVFITGQVNTHEQKFERNIRQLGFQEADICNMARPVVKAAWQVRNAADLPRVLEDAFGLAADGRPGPVLVDIPMDVQRDRVEVIIFENPVPSLVSAKGTEDFWASALAKLAVARKPLILAGGGIRSAGAVIPFRALASRLGVPVVTSLMGLDVPAERLGMIGSYGNRWANIALAECDWLLVLGSRLDVRQTGADTASFKAGRDIFHVDVCHGEMNNRVQGCVTLESDLRPFLEYAGYIKACHAQWEAAGWGANDWSPWVAHLAALKAQFPDTAEQTLPGINPNALMHSLSRLASPDAIFVTDVGQHQMWAAQSLQLNGRRFLTSGGMGAMGFGLPAAIGAYMATGQPVVLIAGDGGFHLNIQELETVVRNHVPIKILVLNNRSLGMVRQFQESYLGGRYQSTVEGYSAPNFAAIARAYGIQSASVSGSELEEELAWAMREPTAPYLLDVEINPKANAYPKLAFGKPLSEMEPIL